MFLVSVSRMNPKKSKHLFLGHYCTHLTSQHTISQMQSTRTALLYLSLMF